MKNKLEEYNIPIILVYLFALVFIKVMRLDNVNYFYFATGICTVFILYRLKHIKLIKNLSDSSSEYKNLVRILMVYICYVLVLTLYIMPEGIIYSFNIIVPFITMIFLIENIINKNELLEKLSKVIFYVFFASSILALIMLLCGYSKVDIHLSKQVLSFISTQSYLDSDQEARLAWLTSQKSRYALFCLIGIIFAYSSEFIKKKKKIMAITLLYINLMLTSSITSIGVGLLVLLYIFRKNIINIFENNKWLRISLYIVTPIIIILAIIFVGKKRNIFTLGSRLYIWQSAFEQIVNHPLGIVAMGSEFLMSNPKLGFYFTNGHNIFLNEMIERGILGGGLFVAVFVYMFKLYKNNGKTIYIVANIGFILGGLIDYTIADEMTYIFWLINAFWCAEAILSNRRESNLTGDS